MNTEMNERLIYDIGLHLGEDSAFYLKKGFDVVAMEANPDLVQKGEKKFSKEIQAGKLKIIHAAIGSESGQTNFYISSKSAWSSANKELAERTGSVADMITVKFVTLNELFQEHGTPYNCKVDIVGNDMSALESLITKASLPKFISVECPSFLKSQEDKPRQSASECIQRLVDLGYNNFKLVEQGTHEVLTIKKRYYRPEFFSIFKYKLNKFVPSIEMLKRSYNNRHYFSYESSVPFGDMFQERCLGHSETMDLVSQSIEDCKSIRSSFSYGYWCDLHAQHKD